MEPTPHSKLCSNDSPPLTAQYSSYCGGGSSVGNSGFCFIEHAVTKFDTLAGVAIKYGVEVTDIKRMNGLTTDLHMFAHKSLRIPLPGRHPPSPVMSNGQTSLEMTPPNHRYSDSIRSLRLSSSPQRNISRPINSLQDYYNHTPNDQNGVDEHFGAAQTSNTSLGPHRRSKGEPNGFSYIPDDPSKSIEKLVRRRKSDADLNDRSPEMLFKQDNSSVLSVSAGKGLLLRQKAKNLTAMELESGSSSMFPMGSRDSSVVQAFGGVRKSSSAPTFRNSETSSSNSKNNNSSASLLSWRTSMLNFVLDFQSLSTAVITSPLFDGLPKPASGRKKKPARD